MTRFRILPYNIHSEGAKAIADGLDGLRLRMESSTYIYQPGDLVINWGNGDCAIPQAVNKDVHAAINKKTFFERLSGLGVTPRFAFTKEEALRHLDFPIVCRTRVEGADGEGVVVAESASQLVQAPLYTQLMIKTHEYRVHLGRLPDGEVVLIGAQRKRLGPLHISPIWTGEHVYFDWCDPSVLPSEVLAKTKAAFAHLDELDFGGFDTVYDQLNMSAYVVEVNSAPLQTPDTTRKYVEFFQRYAAMQAELVFVTALVMEVEEISTVEDFIRKIEELIALYRG